MATIKQIETAYNNAKNEQIAVMQAEEALRAAQLEVQARRQALTKYKDDIAQLHREISEPIFPVASMEGVTLKTS